MTSIKKLEEIRKKEAARLERYTAKRMEKLKKKGIKSDIRKIKAAKTRAILGIESGQADSIGKAFGTGFKGSGKALKGAGKFMGKFMLSLGEELDKQQRRRR